MITNFPQAVSYLRRHVPKFSKRFPGSLGLDRQLAILKLLDNPQDKIKIIHIAGTSGKGSTASYLSQLLSAQNFSVGLSLSPHLLDVRERFQINNKLISKKEFVFYLNQIIPIVEQIEKTKFGKPTFFEILIALSFFIFHQKKVDYAVIETGLGGLLDGTNTISNPNKISVITKIGLDHTAVLGPTLSDIATQKAGIIHPRNIVISIKQFPVVQKILDQSAQEANTSITYLYPRLNYKNIHLQDSFLYYDYSFQDLSLPNIKINTLALYQIENSALAISVLQTISKRDSFIIDQKSVYQSLKSFKFSGRMDLQNIDHHQLILDGAHNPQKMKAFIKSLIFAYPGQKFTFVIAFKQRRDYQKILKIILPLAKRIIITSFLVTSQDMVHTSQSAHSLKDFFKNQQFKNFEIISQPKAAIDKALLYEDPTVVTGSLYLLGEIYPLLKFSSSKD